MQCKISVRPYCVAMHIEPLPLSMSLAMPLDMSLAIKLAIGISNDIANSIANGIANGNGAICKLFVVHFA